MKDIVDKYLKWKKEYPDEDYQYDEICEFMTDYYSRSELLIIMDYLVKQLKEWRE